MFRCVLQAVNGGSPTWFGITVPFDLNTLLAIVSSSSRAVSKAVAQQLWGLCEVGAALSCYTSSDGIISGQLVLQQPLQWCL